METDGVVFARATPESVTIEEEFGFVQEISRNRFIAPAETTPTGRLTIRLPYDGAEHFSRDAARDVARHRQGEAGYVEALIGHLVFTNYQETSLPDVLDIARHHGAMPLCIPIRSAELASAQDLVADRHEYRRDVQYTVTTRKEEVFPLELTVSLTDPDNSPVLFVDVSGDRASLEATADKVVEHVGFRPALTLNLVAHVTLPPGRRLPPEERPKVRKIAVRLPTITSLAPSSLRLMIGDGRVETQYNPNSRCLEWCDVATEPVGQERVDRSRPRRFNSPPMRLEINEPGELLAEEDLRIEAEVEVPGELLSGVQARLFDARGQQCRGTPKNPLVMRSVIRTECTVVLGDAFARRRLTPYLSFHFDEIIPKGIRVTDIVTALSDQRFEVREPAILPSVENQADIRAIVDAERTEGPDTMRLRILVEGRRHRTERQSRQPGGRYTSTFDSGDLRIIVCGAVHRDARELIHEINELQLALRDRLRRLKAPR